MEDNSKINPGETWLEGLDLSGSRWEQIAASCEPFDSIKGGEFLE
jgi:hypothetical protein